jgi:proteasome lid subunit RPN8/RPN11
LITIAASVLESIVAQAREEAPRECCGILVGVGQEILGAVRSSNLSPDSNRYLIDPQTHIAARRTARETGRSIFGFYHSHPHSNALPSAIDLLEASYSGHLYLIAGLGVEPPDIRLYRLESGNFRSVEFVTGT